MTLIPNNSHTPLNVPQKLYFKTNVLGRGNEGWRERKREGSSERNKVFESASTLQLFINYQQQYIT
jgi:hypothetical protein